MSSRFLFLDLRIRQPSICRSCLLNFQRSSPQARWLHETSPTAARARSRPSARPSGIAPRIQPALLTNDETGQKPFPSSAVFEDEEDSLNFFEQDENGKLKDLGGPGDFNKSLFGMDPAVFQKDIAADVGRLAKMMQGEETIRDINWSSLAEELKERVGNTTDVREIHRQLGEYIKELEGQLDQMEDPLTAFEDKELKQMQLDPRLMQLQQEARDLRRSPVPQLPADAWTKSQRRRVAELNTMLERTTRHFRRAELPPAKTIQSTWKIYSQARQFLALSWDKVPTDVWNLLWKIFSTEGVRDDRNRLSRISLLAKDMSAAKVALQPSQQLLTMEAMFVDGWEKNAIDNWKRCISTLGDEGNDNFHSFWELGVRMWCKLRNLDEATRAINKLLSQQADPRILMPYIRTCVELGSEEGQAEAWRAYSQLKELLGPDMVIEDYDQVISFLLSANQIETALEIFVDMMTAGNVSLRGKKHLPSMVANKFFFGKWLKRLIGAGDLQGAYSVVQFMRAKRIEASPIQINGLIGAWQRSGGAEDLKLADDIAWEMIQARVEFVRQRKRLAEVQGQDNLKETYTRPKSRPIAKATLETFNLLAENYRLRQLTDRMRELWDAFSEAEIRPDAFMMNQLLESYSNDGHVDRAKELYRSFVHERNVTPDPYTFMALFKMLAANRQQTVPAEHIGSETALTRATFAEMIRFRAVFDPSEGIDGQLARKILHTFRRVQDPIGLVLALRTMTEAFHFLPPDSLILEMVIGTTNLAWDTPRARERLRIASRQLENDILQRLRACGGPDAKAKSLSEVKLEKRAQELSAYLERSFLPSGSARDDYGMLLDNAAREMGVYDIVHK